ncbi:MAG TPA: hypothetical protein VFU32_12880 [Ktedonobacterales bacterium]|nr:hypothetical protein [Ktedonobacterales bacterium]
MTSMRWGADKIGYSPFQTSCRRASSAYTQGTSPPAAINPCTKGGKGCAGSITSPATAAAAAT